MISRTVHAVEAMELVKNDSLGARASRPRSQETTTGCSETNRAGPVELPAKVGGERAS